MISICLGIVGCSNKENNNQKQTEKNHKEQVEVKNKEKEAKSYADKLASEVTFNVTTNDSEELEFTTMIENTSDIDFKDLYFKVQYKNKDGVIVEEEELYLYDFEPKSIEKINLMPADQSADKAFVTTDRFKINL